MNERRHVKDKKRNINQPQQRDPWSALQAQLGLLSTPVQHEQVSMVGAVDPREETPVESSETQTDNAIVENVPTENQIVNSPEEETVTVSFEEKKDAFQMFEFDDFGECDIPPNAFGAPPKEKEVVQPAESQIAMDFLQETVEEQTIVAETAASPLDPLASDELPTFLWQPKKPASIATPPAPKTSATRESIKQTRDDIAKPKADVLAQEITQSDSPDDLNAHSSGKKRRERGKDRSERSEERKTPVDAERKGFGNFGGEKRPRQPEETPRDDDFNDFSTFEEEKLHDVFHGERAEEDFSRPSKSSKRKKRGKIEQEERDFSESEFAGGFGTGLDDSYEKAADREWLDEPTSARKNDGPSKRRRGRKSNDEMETPVSKENERDLRGRETRRDDRNDDAREDRGRQRSRNQEAAPSRPAPQKIVVPSWDDAVSGIIENNMRRHPVKNDRKSNGAGGRGRRR